MDVCLLFQLSMNDFRYAFRSLRQKPGFALTAILSIALGIGANATVFSIADGLLLRPLPVPNASQVYTLSSRSPSGTLQNFSYRDFVDFRDKSKSFEGLVAYRLGPFGFAKDAKQQAEMKAGFLVSGNFFRVLGVEPKLGRGFRPDEDQAPGRDAVVVLGHEFWENEFAADPSVIGRPVRLNNLEFTVVGVAPAGFTGMDQYFRPSFFVPAMMGPKLLVSNHDLLTDRADRSFMVKGRLKPGVSQGAANAESASLAKALGKSYPDTNRSVGTAVHTEMQAREDDTMDGILVKFLFSVVILVLLIACANVANLSLSRGQARAREIAVRLAIGASRLQIARGLLAESLLVATAGGLASLLIAQAGISFASRLQVPSDLPVHLTFELDYRVICFTAIAALLSALLFGLAPAFRSSKADLVPALKAGELDRSRERLFGRNALVVAQVAGSLVLMVCATQLFRGFSYLLSHNPGFQIAHRLTMSFDPSLVRYTPEQTKEFYKTFLDRVRNVPGVRSATLAYFVPLGTNYEEEEVVPEGYRFPPGQSGTQIFANTVDESYFRTLATPVLQGREFRSSDTETSPRVAIVNQAFAKRFGMLNPIGKRLHIGGPQSPLAEIVGVTGTGKYLAVVESPLEFIYLPMAQHFESRMTLIADTESNALLLAEPIRKLINSLAPGLPVYGVRTFEDLFEQRATRVMNLILGLISSMGVIGLGLALVGLYAVIAYQVARRTREIGIRMAIGAGKGQVVKMFLRQAVWTGLAGAVIGCALSVGAARVLNAMIQVPAFDPLLFFSVVLGLLLTTALAAAIPARRASLIDPMQAMRQD